MWPEVEHHRFAGQGALGHQTAQLVKTALPLGKLILI
jgi:hypothetical protein